MKTLLYNIYIQDLKQLTCIFENSYPARHIIYLHSGMPIYSHESVELHKFRYITSNLLVQGLCKNVDIEKTFHVSTDSVRRWKKRLVEEGEEAISYYRMYWAVSRRSLMKDEVACRVLWATPYHTYLMLHGLVPD